MFKIKRKILLFLGLAVLMQFSGSHKIQECRAAVNESESYAEEGLLFRSYEIGKDEVRDTSFTLSRTLLEEPAAFMKALTDVQMINREFTDTYNYTEKLLFGDSILGEICKKIARSENVPVYLTDVISDWENHHYYFNLRKKGDKSHISYSLNGGEVVKSTCKLFEPYRKLVDEWNKKEMFSIGATDEERKKYVMSSGMVLFAERIGKSSGCITRLRCSKDSVYVDMIKLYLWALEEIPDEEEVMEILKRKEERLKKSR